jgi:CelD/BcsL family acetyltransferase involved in cellulose biosynthesis
LTTNLIGLSAASGAAAQDEVRIHSPAPRDVWRAVLAADPDALPTQTPEWLDCLCATRGRVDASRLYELPDGRRLVLPLAARRWAGIPVVEECWPHGWGYGGVLVEGGGLTDADRRLVLADLARRPGVRTAVVPNPLTAASWSAVSPPRARQVMDRTQIVDLTGGFETVWGTRFRKETRNRVRKSERVALDIRREHGGSAGRGVAMFAELYHRAVDRWAEDRGQPQWVARRLAARRDRPGAVTAAAAAMGERCVIFSAARDGEPVAVDVVLQHGRHSLAWLGAVDPALARETMATYRLQSMAIEDACRAGAQHFHLGESEAGSGVERFKRNFGGVTVEYPSLRFERLPLTAGEQRLRAAFASLSAFRSRRAERSGAQ